MEVGQSIYDDLDTALAPLSLRALDVSRKSRSLIVLVEREDCSSPSIEEIAAASPVVSEVLSDGPLVKSFGGPWDLEVSSPGLERPLKTLEHFHYAFGREVEIKKNGGDRIVGTVARIEDSEARIEIDGSGAQGSTLVALDEIARARLVFSWGRKEE